MELFVDRSIKGAVIPTRNWLGKPPLKPAIQLKPFRMPITQKIVNKTPNAGLSSIKPKPNKGNQPPKNNIEPRAHINRIFAYSPSQNIAYIIPEYSV